MSYNSSIIGGCIRCPREMKDKETSKMPEANNKMERDVSKPDFLTPEELETMSLPELEVYINSLMISDYTDDELLMPVGQAINAITDRQLYISEFATLKLWLEDYAERTGQEEQLFWDIKRVYERYQSWAQTKKDPSPLGTGLLTLDNIFQAIRFARRNGDVLMAYIESLDQGEVPEQTEESYSELASEGRKLRLLASFVPAAKREDAVVFSRRRGMMTFPDAETLEKACYFLSKAGIPLKSADYL